MGVSTPIKGERLLDDFQHGSCEDAHKRLYRSILRGVLWVTHTGANLQNLCNLALYVGKADQLN